MLFSSICVHLNFTSLSNATGPFKVEKARCMIQHFCRMRLQKLHLWCWQLSFSMSTFETLTEENRNGSTQVMKDTSINSAKNSKNYLT